MRCLILVAASFAIISLCSCSKPKQPAQAGAMAPAQTKSENTPRLTGSSSWYIDHYDNGIITARHDGNVYRASCVETSSYAHDFSNVIRSPSCTLCIELVGQEIKAFGSQVSPDANGRTIVALNVGERLILRMWDGKNSGVRDEEFKITSVTKSLR